jgi:hypothetical protein
LPSLTVTVRSQLVSVAPTGSVTLVAAAAAEKTAPAQELVHAYDRVSPSASLAVTVREVGEPSTM